MLFEVTKAPKWIIIIPYRQHIDNIIFVRLLIECFIWIILMNLYYNYKSELFGFLSDLRDFQEFNFANEDSSSTLRWLKSLQTIHRDHASDWSALQLERSAIYIAMSMTDFILKKTICVCGRWTNQNNSHVYFSVNVLRPKCMLESLMSL